MGETLRVDEGGFLIGHIFVGILIHELAIVPLKKIKNVEHTAFKYICIHRTVEVCYSLISLVAMLSKL